MKTNLKLSAIFLSAAMITACSSVPKDKGEAKATDAQKQAQPANPKATPAPVAAAPVTATNVATCKRTGEERSLEIEAIQPKGCKLWYSKNGTRSSIASSSVGSTHCETVRSRIEETLKGAGFQCQK